MDKQTDMYVHSSHSDYIDNVFSEGRGGSENQES